MNEFEYDLFVKILEFYHREISERNRTKIMILYTNCLRKKADTLYNDILKCYIEEGQNNRRIAL